MNILENLEREWAQRHHHTSTATAAAALTIKTNTGGTMSFITTLKADAHAFVDKLEAIDETALNALEAILANPRTNTAFALIASLTHVDPTPEFDAVLTLLKALAPQQVSPQAMPAAAEPSFTPNGPNVGGVA